MHFIEYIISYNRITVIHNYIILTLNHTTAKAIGKHK